MQVAASLHSAALNEELAAAASRYRLLYEAMPCGVLVQDPQGVVVEANRAAEVMLGVDRSLLVGSVTNQRAGWPTFAEDGTPIGPDEYPSTHARTTGKGVHNVVIRLVLPGRDLWVRVDAEPMQRPGGELDKVVTSFTDITDVKLASAEQRASREQLAAVAEHAPVALVALDRDGRIQLAQGQLVAGLGFRQDDIAGRRLVDLLPRGGEVRTHLRRALRGEAGELTVTEHGFTLEIRYRALLDDRARVERVIAVVSDVSARRRAADAERESAAKSRFLAAMSHELRTPLNSILGFSQLLADPAFGALSERQERYIGNIASSGSHLLDLINDVLDLSKVAAGQMGVELAIVPLAESVEQVCGRLRPLAQAREIHVEWRCGAGLKVRADPLRLIQVLSNLVTNAVKFTEPGGRVDVVAGRRAGAVQVHVRDTGIGIAPAEQERIFQEFMQIERPDRRQEGTGLGLALSRRLVHLMDGTLAVTSEPGCGSTFTVTLPEAP